LTDREQNCPPAEEVRRAVGALLASDEFRTSKRLQRFLSYIVEKTLAGCEGEIKEYNIAVDVFDRGASFNSGTDNIVRVEARRLRQQLAAYYQGSADPVVVELPKGRYIPLFRTREGTTAESAHPPPVGSGGRRSTRVALSLGGVAVLAVALAGFWAWRAGVVAASRVPHHWSLDGSQLTVLDASGRVVWQKHFPPFHREFGIEVHDKALIGDVDGDGRTEVLFTFLPEDIRNGTGALLCFEQNGRQRWQSTYGVPKTFGDRTFGAGYRGRLLRLAKIAGKPYILTIANHHLWYPSQVAIVDPRTGRTVEDYWHPGAIYHCVLQDIDGDGQDEVIFAGINNPGEGLGHAGVGILKLPFSKTPLPPPQPGDPFPPLTGGGEAAYALLPLPDTSRALGLLPGVVELKVDERRHIVVEVGIPESGGIVYYLDFALHLQEFGVSDNFPAVHERLFRQHLLDHRLSPAEKASLGVVATFPAAPNGNSPELKRFWKF
jgi:hypothetical protein